LRARKDIEDDRFAGAKRAVAAFVRIAGLQAAGDDRVARQAAGLDDRGINDGAQFSEVRGMLWYIRRRLRPTLQFFRACIPSASPTSAIIKAALIF